MGKVRWLSVLSFIAVVVALVWLAAGDAERGTGYGVVAVALAILAHLES